MSDSVRTLGHCADFSALSDVSALVRCATEALEDAGVPSPSVDAELLIGHVLGASRGEVQAFALTGRSVTAADAATIGELVSRRAAREPLQHITGIAYFRFIELEVGPGVFVPRPETELLVSAAIERLPVGGRAIDLGTGSGAIAWSIAYERRDVQVTAVEASPAAFTWAHRNRRRLGLTNASLIHGDFADPSTFSHLDLPVDVVVTNPPYVPTGAIPRDPEVWLHDPELALYSGSDGLDAIRAIAGIARDLVRAGGALLIEHGEYQGAGVRGVLTGAGWVGAETLADLTGRDRVTLATR